MFILLLLLFATVCEIKRCYASKSNNPCFGSESGSAGLLYVQEPDPVPECRYADQDLKIRLSTETINDYCLRLKTFKNFSRFWFYSVKKSIDLAFDAYSVLCLGMM